MSLNHHQAMKELEYRLHHGEYNPLRFLELLTIIKKVLPVNMVDAFNGDVPMPAPNESLQDAMLRPEQPNKIVNVVTEGGQSELDQLRSRLETMTDDLRYILGSPNFACAGLAEKLRTSGKEIKRKSEHEQAAVIHFLLLHYVFHGDEWNAKVDEELTRMSQGGSNEQPV